MAQASSEPVMVILADNTAIGFTKSDAEFRPPRAGGKIARAAPRGLGGMLKSLLHRRSAAPHSAR